jgi:dipeptidase E
MPPQRQLIAMGGGGFSMEPDNPALDTYILKQSGATRPRVCFLATACGDAAGYISSFYRAFSAFDCRPSHLAFFQRTPDVKSMLLNQDVIYVGGGNTKSMLAVWREWSVDSVLREAWESGIVLAGISAGAICWFQQGVTDSFADKLVALDCLGFLKGSCCPHYDGEVDRRPSLHDLILRSGILPGYAIDDGAAVHFIGEQVHCVATSRRNAKAYYVSLVDEAVDERELKTDFVGNQ